jgi:hypothetical protein
VSGQQCHFHGLRTEYASIRIPEAQPESTDDPDLGQINGSNSGNHPDSSALIGLDALLQVLQSANASNVVSSPPPDSFDFSRPSTHVSENAVQVAATALNQLSQQDVPDTYHPFASMILPVCSFSQRYIFFTSRCASLRQFRGFGTLPTTSSELQRDFPNQKITTFLLSYYFDRSSVHWMFPIIHRPCFESCYRTFSSGELPPTIEFIALLAITCATALQFLPETDEDVRPRLLSSHNREYSWNSRVHCLLVTHRGGKSCSSA